MASLSLAFDILAKDNASKTFNTVGESASRLGKAGVAVGTAIGGLAAGGIAAGLGAIKNFAAGSVDAFARVEDATGAAGVVFGEAAKQITAFADTAASKFGLSKGAALDASLTFGTLGKAAGLSGGDLSGFAQKFTGLAGDLASFRGTSPEQAVEAIGAALRGEAEPIRAYGVLLDDASLRQEALAQGLIKTTKDALSPQNKALAAAALITKQTSDAQGDFARTGESTANTQKRLAAETENASAKLGQQLAPAVTALREVFLGLITGASGFVTVIGPAIANFVSSFKTGEVSATGFIGKVQEVGSFLGHVLVPTLQKFAQAAKDAFSVFFTALGNGEVTTQGALGRIGDAAYALRDGFVAVLPFLQQVAAFIADNIVPILGGVLVPIIATLAGSIGGALVGGLVAFIGVLASPVVLIAALAAALIYAYRESEQFREVIGTVIAFITRKVIPAFLEFAENVIATIGDAVEYVRRIWPQIMEAIRVVLDAVLAIVRIWIGVVSGAWRLFGDDLLRFAREAFDFIRDTISNALDLIKGIIQTVLALIRGDWSAAFDGLKEILSAFWAQAQNIVDLAWAAITAAFGIALSLLKEIFTVGWDVLKGIVSAAWEGIKGLVSDGWEAVKSATSTALDAVVGFVTGLPGRFVAALAALGGLLAGVATAAWESFRASAATKVAELITLAAGIAGRIKTGLGNLGELLVSAGRELIAGLIRGVTAKLGALREKMRDVASAVKDFLPGSPVKTGPLTSWNNGGAGKRLMGMLEGGIAAGLPSVVGTLNSGLSGINATAGADLTGMGGTSVAALLAEQNELLRRMPRDYQLGQRQMAGV